MGERAVEEVFRAPRVDLSVEDETEVVLDAENERLSEARKLVEIRTFADLQQLSLIPDWLDEHRFSEAFARDDEEARQLAREYVASSPNRSECGCPQEAQVDVPFKQVYGRAFRDAYVGIRKSHSPHLAEYMSEASGSSYEAGDLQVTRASGVYGAITKAMSPIMHYIWALNDVEIGKNATLTLGPAEKGLYCGGLKIHVGGKLVVKGSGVKIRCLSAHGNLS